eukprot:173214_1
MTTEFIEDNDDFEYTEEDMLDMDVLFGTCDIESKLYTNCLRDAKTKRHKGWRKYWYPEWTLLKKECQQQAQELDLCTLKLEWRQKVAQVSCHHLNVKYQACLSLVNKVRRSQPTSAISHGDCLESFTEFMTCARDAIKQREFENKFSIT